MVIILKGIRVGVREVGKGKAVKVWEASEILGI